MFCGSWKKNPYQLAKYMQNTCLNTFINCKAKLMVIRTEISSVITSSCTDMSQLQTIFQGERSGLACMTSTIWSVAIHTKFYFCLLPSSLPSFSALSCVGSLLIIFSYWRWKDIRTGSRSVITFLAIADFFTAFGYIIGSINHITYYGKYDDTPPCATFLQICEVQSYITTWSSLSSFTWTCALAIYLYFTVVRKRIVLALKMIPVFHVIAWGVPIAICLPLLIEGKLGYTPYAVSTWCFIGDSNPSGHSGKISAETVGLVFLAGKGAEIFTYILVTVLYIAIKYHIWKEVSTS